MWDQKKAPVTEGSPNRRIIEQNPMLGKLLDKPVRSFLETHQEAGPSSSNKSSPSKKPLPSLYTIKKAKKRRKEQLPTKQFKLPDDLKKYKTDKMFDKRLDIPVAGSSKTHQEERPGHSSQSSTVKKSLPQLIPIQQLRQQSQTKRSNLPDNFKDKKLDIAAGVRSETRQEERPGTSWQAPTVKRSLPGLIHMGKSKKQKKQSQTKRSTLLDDFKEKKKGKRLNKMLDRAVEAFSETHQKEQPKYSLQSPKVKKPLPNLIPIGDLIKLRIQQSHTKQSNLPDDLKEKKKDEMLDIAFRVLSETGKEERPGLSVQSSLLQRSPRSLPLKKRLQTRQEERPGSSRDAPPLKKSSSSILPLKKRWQNGKNQ